MKQTKGGHLPAGKEVSETMGPKQVVKLVREVALRTARTFAPELEAQGRPALIESFLRICGNEELHELRLEVPPRGYNLSLDLDDEDTFSSVLFESSGYGTVYFEIEILFPSEVARQDFLSRVKRDPDLVCNDGPIYGHLKIDRDIIQGKIRMFLKVVLEQGL
jgi:hypothetical protein